MSDQLARRMVVHGRVQGVGFRFAMIDAATSLGVEGWVRNRRDGSVEAHLQGGREAVDALVAWARRGPPAARVTNVDLADASFDTGLAGFENRPTA